MSVAEIKRTKLQLIAWIEQLSDTSTLAFLEGLKESKSSNDWWENISESQKQHINEGLNDAESGRIVSSAEFWNKLRNG
jgi:predicted transcriptional regulator